MLHYYTNVATTRSGRLVIHPSDCLCNTCSFRRAETRCNYILKVLYALTFFLVSMNILLVLCTLLPHGGVARMINELN